MPCEIGSSLRGGCESVFGIQFFNSIFSSTLWSAFLITFVILILLMLIIPVAEDTPMSALFKFMFYSFVTSLTVVFLHNGAINIKKENEESKYFSRELADRMENPTTGGMITTEGDTVDVKPTVVSTIGAEEATFQHFGV